MTESTDYRILYALHALLALSSQTQSSKEQFVFIILANRRKQHTLALLLSLTWGITYAEWKMKRLATCGCHSAHCDQPDN
jgi:hypothetical protein